MAGCSQRHLINSPSGLLPRNFCSQKYVCHAVGRGVKGQGAHNIITAPFAIGKRFLLAQCGLKIREPWEFDRLLIAYFVGPIIGSHKASTRRIEFRNHVGFMCILTSLLLLRSVGHLNLLQICERNRNRNWNWNGNAKTQTHCEQFQWCPVYFPPAHPHPAPPLA